MEEKLTAWDELIKKIRSDFRSHKSKYRELDISRTLWRTKYKDLKVTNDKLHLKLKCGWGVRSGSKIARHKYDGRMVGLCLSIYLLGNCSFRSVLKIIKCFELCLGLEFGQLPCKSSIENWIKKCGYAAYVNVDEKKYESGYALIVDECLVIGQERLLAVLMVRSEKTESGALKFSDIEVVHLESRGSWTGEAVQKVLEKVSLKMGYPPAYYISDGCSNLKKGIREAEGIRVFDIGHEIARLTERAYKESEDFKAFTADVSAVKFKEVMRPTHYLLPPGTENDCAFHEFISNKRMGRPNVGGFHVAE